MTIWQPDLGRRRGPVYLAIAQALADDMDNGRLRPGTRLPTHRDLADHLGVTVGTVTRAYAEAARRGVIAGEVGRGTFVRASTSNSAPAAAPQASGGFIDLGTNLPPVTVGEDRGVPLARTLARLSRRKDLARLLAYPPEGGAPAHRAAGAAWMERSGLDAAPSRVLVSSGSQHGMTAVFTALLRPGDLVLTEALTYAGMKTLAGLLSLRLQGVAVDEHGMRPDALAAACRARAPRALYCVPTLQNPTAALMPEERRREIAALARAHDVLIVEDDVHGRLLDRGPRPLSMHAPERSIYLTGVSKALSPGLRVGFVHAPEAFLPRIAAAIRGTTWMAAPLMAEITSLWITDGTAEGILGRRRKEAAARQKVAAEVLREARVQTHGSSYHLWLHLPAPWRSESFVDAAWRRGVAVTAASAFAVSRAAPPEAVRVCLGAAKDSVQLRAGLETIAGLLGSAPDQASGASGP